MGWDAFAWLLFPMRPRACLSERRSVAAAKGCYQAPNFHGLDPRRVPKEEKSISISGLNQDCVKLLVYLTVIIKYLY